MFPRGLTSIYQTAGGQGLSWELKVAAQECQKLFLQEIKEHLIAPLLPAASGFYTEQNRNPWIVGWHWYGMPLPV